MASAFDIAARGADSAYKVRQVNEERRKGQFDNSFISQALEKYNDPNDPASYNQTVNQILSRVSPQKAKGVLDQLGYQEKQKQEGSRIQKLGDYYESQGLDKRLAYGPDSVQAQAVKGSIENDLSLKFRDYSTIEGTFGKNFADLWQTSTQGGKTKLIQTGVDALVRGEDVDKLISGLPQTDRAVADDIGKIQTIEKTTDGKFPSVKEWPRFDEKPPGYSLKEWNEEKKTWRKENAPIFDKNKTKLGNTKKDLLSTRNLQNLNSSGKLPEGFERSLINPSTGEFYKLAELSEVVSPEAQQWVKEIARFQNRAKDSFGARVTNFDLVSFMKQFPNLMNTTDGRRRILSMMETNYKLDELYQNTLDKVYKRSGLSNIPMELADSTVQHMIGDDVQKLYDEYLDISAGKYKTDRLQAASGKKGDTAVNNKTGQRYSFDGKQWVEVN